LLELKSSKPKPQLNDERREKAQTQKWQFRHPLPKELWNFK
jgi:hypothetical protein